MLRKVDARNQPEIVLEEREQKGSQIEQNVKEILDQVKAGKDQALIELTEKFDGIRPEKLEVSRDEIEAQAKLADPEFVEALQEAAENIREYHSLQKREGYELKRPDGSVLGSRIIPLEKVGLYVPGGSALYPSSVLMNALPAKIAGVSEVILVTPPSKSGKISPDLAAAVKLCGIDRVFQVGGAQAVGALAFGTESIPKVDKIVGPGNAYVAEAKKQVFGKVSIDMIAGPSEILVIADDSANPQYVAADLLSQAEHDPRARAILVTPSQELIEKVDQALKEQLEKLPRKEIAEKSILDEGLAILVENLEQAVEIANEIAPEHLEVQIDEPFSLLEKIRNAGSVFLGHTSCESVGDYFAGVNHVLPTSGTARFFSPLSVDDFIKKSSYLYYPEDVLNKNGKKIMKLAEHEGLDAHGKAVEVRL